MKKAFCFLMVILLLPIYAAAETKFIERPFDISCDIFLEYLQLTMGNEVDDQKTYISQGIYLETETSSILIMKDDTPVFPRVRGLGVSVQPSKYEHPSDCAVSLTADAISVYRAVTQCKSNDIKELYDTFLSLGIIDSTINETPINSIYTIYEDCLISLSADYESDLIQYVIMKNPFVEKPKFKEFENTNEGE